MTCAKKKRIQTRSYGKVEFCLTKLAVTSFADRVIGHVLTRSTPSAYSRDWSDVLPRQGDRDVYDLRVEALRHFIGVRVGDEHMVRLKALVDATGFSRGELLRRALLNAEIPSARTRQEVQDLLRIQREQNRLGGLLKKALTEREEKASLRRTLVEVERNAAELRRVIAHLVRSR